jgi:hypothetical protein
MIDNPRAILFKLPEYRAISNRKKRHYLESVLIDRIVPTRAAKLLGLNAGRMTKDREVRAVAEAFQVRRDPGGLASMFEGARRLHLLWDGYCSTPADPDFAEVNLPWGPEAPNVYLTPEGKTVDAAGHAIPAPSRPAPVTPAATPAATCAGCQKPDATIAVGTPSVAVCPKCKHVWDHTGVKPNGPNDPNLNRVEPRWGLNGESSDAL